MSPKFLIHGAKMFLSKLGEFFRTLYFLVNTGYVKWQPLKQKKIKMNGQHFSTSIFQAIQLYFCPILVTKLIWVNATKDQSKKVVLNCNIKIFYLKGILNASCTVQK